MANFKGADGGTRIKLVCDNANESQLGTAVSILATHHPKMEVSSPHLVSAPVAIRLAAHPFNEHSVLCYLPVHWWQITTTRPQDMRIIPAKGSMGFQLKCKIQRWQFDSDAQPTRVPENRG